MLEMFYFMLLADAAQDSVAINILSNFSVIEEDFITIRSSVLKFQVLKLLCDDLISI